MMSKDIKMKIKSQRYDVEGSLFSKLASEYDESDEPDIELFGDELLFDDEEIIELNTEGVINIGEKRVELVYEESEITGMEGSQTSISFEKDSAGLVSMMRDGTVSTALVFEKGKRHHCVYNTPIMPFEICVKTLTVEKGILTDGRLKLDYIIEIRGAKAERTKFELSFVETQGTVTLNEASV